MKRFLIIGLILFLNGCVSTYKSSWDYPNPKGIGGHTVEYADEIARQKIILNDVVLKKVKSKKAKSITVGEHYEGFEEQPTKEMRF